MKTFFDAFLTSIAILLAVPAVLILASWNALPGEALYTTKTSFEKVALAVTIKTPLASMLSLNFTDRRFGEANRLLAKEGSTLGYTLLVTQASQSKDIIVGKQDVKQAAVLVQNIENYQKSIAEKKAVLATQPSAVVPSSVTGSAPVATPYVPTVAPFIPTSTPAPSAAPAAATEPTPAASVSVVIANLDQTSSQLEELRQEIIRDVPESQSIQPGNQGQHQNQGQGRDKDKDKDKND
ncbi:DUF5667 domain-containing protein [Patescibacteria group bacterium]|nr:DUF5667 domain-containing protein [Patescibacteria group bacterium]